VTGPTPLEVEADVWAGSRRIGLTGRMSRDGIPGLTAAAVIDASPAWSRAHGLASAEDGSPVAADTVFQACSLSKPVAAVGVLTLVADGRIGLDEDVRSKLAYDVPRHRLYRGGDPAITVRRLLMHRNGITGRGTTPDKTGRRFVRGGGGSVRLPGTYDRPIPTVEDFWPGYRGRRGVMVTHASDQQRSYSGLGYLVLEHLCEQVTGRPFSDWMSERVLDPIGMHASSFDLDPDLGLPLASGHDRHGRVLPGQREICPWSAAAGLYTTAADLARFVACLVDRGQARGAAVVDADLVETMLGEGLCVSVVGHGSRARFTHTGSNGGFRTVMVGYPHQRGGVVAMANGAGSDVQAGINALAVAAGRAYGWPYR